MAEQFCTVGDVELCFETFGDPGDPAMLLIMGLGTQMLAWHDDFCAQLADHGFHVIRFDNRDVGRSQAMEGPVPTLKQMVLRDRRAAAYTLSDMAGDAVGLLDHLGVEHAHLTGASMGGMIAQTVAIEHPQRVRSLASIMSNTGSLWNGQPSPRIYPVLLRRPARGREEYVRHTAWAYEQIGSPGFPRDEDELRALAELSYERGLNPAGSGRQLAAIIAAPDRTPGLRRLTIPTVVIHGTADRLVAPSGGRATARAIPGARLVMIEGMGHDMPRAVWPTILGAIADNASRAAAPADRAA